jgi:molybdopterin converting factor subunit 1
MIVRVKLFAVARDLAGEDSLRLELALPATVRELRTAAAQQYPGLADVLRHCVFAVNAEYAGEGAVISAADEVVCIPPVSGG